MSETPTVKCPGCDRVYRVRSELAGRKVKCKCGQALRMPELPPASPFAQEDQYDLATPDDGDEAATSASPAKAKCPNCGQGVTPAAVICINCGFHIKAGKKIKTTVQSAATSPPLAAPLRTARPIPDGLNSAAPLGGQIAAAALTSSRRAEADADFRQEGEKSARMTDLIVPLILILLGAITLPVRGYMLAKNPATALLFTAVYTFLQVVITLPFLFLGILLTARIMQTSFGPITTAFLKLLAIALFLAGVVGLINDAFDKYTMGMFTMFIGYIIQIVAFWALCAYLFGLDVMETFVLWFISIFAAGWAMFFLLILVSSLFA